MNLLINANAKHIPLADKSVDMVFTSVPFKDDDVEGYYWNELFDWMEEILRVVKNVAIVIQSITKLQGMLEDFPADRILVWGKGVSQYSYRWNPILVYQLGDYKVNKYIWSDAFGVESVTGKWKVHKYQDPVLLYKTIIGMFKDCQTVLDPFVGSGTTGVACQLLGLDFIGMDIDEKHLNTARVRVMERNNLVADGITQLTIY